MQGEAERLSPHTRGSSLSSPCPTSCPPPPHPPPHPTPPTHTHTHTPAAPNSSPAAWQRCWPSPRAATHGCGGCVMCRLRVRGALGGARGGDAAANGKAIMRASKEGVHGGMWRRKRCASRQPACPQTHTHTHTDSPALLQRPAAEATAPLGIAQPPCSLLPAHHSLLQISLPARTPALHPPAEAAEALTTLPGIGPKVAACICLFSLDKHEAIPGACGRGKARVAPLVDWTEGSAVWNLGHLTAAARLPAPLAMLLSRAHELCLQRGAST